MSKHLSNRARDAYRALIEKPEQFPIQFALDGKRYQGFPACCFETVKNEENGDRNTIVLRYSDALQVRLETACYPAYGAYEWTAWFENNGSENSPVISDLAAYQTFEGENPRLIGITGDRLSHHIPYCADLTRAPMYFKNIMGRATHLTFPFFNLQHGDGGTLIALGWGGTWDGKFEVRDGKTIFRGNGVTGLKTYLKPGEKIRTALFACLCYEGRDEDDAANAWRRWIVDCNLPKANVQGDPVAPFLAEDNTSISYVKRLEEAGVHLDYNWIDAGWYAAADGSPIPRCGEGGMLANIGSWAVDDGRCGEGMTFREFIDASHELGTKTLVWFEPERVTHVDDLVRCYGYKAEWAMNGYLNDLGNEECFEWVYGRIRQALDSMNVDMYREDFNCEPVFAWEWGDKREGENRKGVTENKYMVGHYRLWDRIIADQGKQGKTTFIDSCASGGGRNDLETMRRSVPLLRSDFDRTTTALRLSISHSLNKWLPFNGAVSMETEEENNLGISSVDAYVMRASYLCKVHMPYDTTLQNSGLDDSFSKKYIDEWRSMNRYLLKDFYPLTPWVAPNEKDRWTVFEYLDPDTDSGVVQAFRMEQCCEDSCTVKLKGLKADGVYDLVDADNGENGCTAVSGKTLMEGLTLKLGAPKSSALLYIQPAK